MILAFGASACGNEQLPGRQRLAVLSAFPAELAALLEQAVVDETLTIEGRVFRIGTLGGVDVVLAMTGIGLANAAATTQLLFDNFPVDGVVVSGVAGSFHRIGDVVVPETWELREGSRFAADASWLARAAEIASAADLYFQRCTSRPEAPAQPPVCLLHQPVIVVGGRGRSDDPFGETPAPCQPNGGDVFGCEVDSAGATETERSARTSLRGGEQPIAEDMESAAIAREAAARGLPFIAFRAVSDGAGDPLNLPGFPAQFFTYYRLAAHNAALATVAFLENLSRSP